METQQQASLGCWCSEMEVTNAWFSLVAVNACESLGTELKKKMHSKLKKKNLLISAENKVSFLGSFWL